MRTKTILLTAALVAAGALSSVAQSNVYSLNVVGYVNMPTVANHFLLIENPLNNGVNNTITNVLQVNDTFDQSLVYTYTGGTLTPVETYFAGFGWFPGTTVLAPGTGFYFLPTTNSTVTFTGSVVTNSTKALPAGFSLVGSAFPAALSLTAAGLTGNDQDFVYRYQGGSLSDISTFFSGYGWFETGPTAPGDGGPVTGPTLGVGEAFFYLNAGNGTPVTFSWGQNFVIQ